MSIRNIRLLLAYDGTDFNGWQIQKDDRTVQGEIEKGLSRMHKKPVRITAAGRTDSGVHARGQVANFQTDIDAIPPDQFSKAINTFLPKDVRVLSSCEVAEDFHARYDAKRRTYRYYLYPDAGIFPWQRRYCLPLYRRPDIRRMLAMADCFIGTHDFSAFSSVDEERKSTHRYMETSAFFMEGEYLVYQITGNAFLWKMVRSVLGTMLEFESEGKGPEDIAAVLESKDRRNAGKTAPAYGLFLHHIVYED